MAHKALGPDESPRSAEDMDEIVPGLWLGGVQPIPEARALGFKILGVRHLPHADDDVHIPVLVGNHNQQLDRVATTIEGFLQANQPVLVHCLVGMERAPLAVAWYLHTKLNMTLDSAYELVKSKHPITQDRREWLGHENLQGVAR
jgi:hypothetical protein